MPRELLLKPESDADASQGSLIERSDGGLPIMRSKGPTDFVCYSCGSTLLASMWSKQVQGMYFKCPTCGAVNYKGFL